MAELQRRGQRVELFEHSRALSYDSVVFDAWSLFPERDREQPAAQAVALAFRLKQRGVRIILDNCDNQFAGWRPTPEWERGVERLRALAALADRIVVCSESLATAMREQTAARGACYVIDDPVELRIRYPADTALRAILSPGRKLSWARFLRLQVAIMAERMTGRIPLVWFGSHGNFFAEGGMLDLLAIRDLVEEAGTRYPLSLTVISNHPAKYLQNIATWSVPTHYLWWDRLTFLAALRLHTISLIPANLNAFTRCKSSNRLVLSLAQGLAVIADPIPSYQRLSDYCLLGNWRESLQTYLSDDQTRRVHVQAGAARVVRDFSISAIADQWQEAVFGENRDEQRRHDSRPEYGAPVDPT